MDFGKTMSERIGWRRRLRAGLSLAFWTGTFPSLVVSIAIVGVGLTLSVLLPPLDVLPSESSTIIGIVETVLQAQAAMMAISLAVMAFIVSGVQRRQDLDDPLYEWFLTRAFVRPVFALTVSLTLGTAGAYFLVRIWTSMAPPNLVLFAGGSIGVAIAVIVAFAFVALRILRPSRFRDFQREVTLSSVKKAGGLYADYLKAFQCDKCGDGHRELKAGNEANRAMQRVVDDAERATREARFTDFEESTQTLMQALRELIAESSLSVNIENHDKIAAAPLPWPVGLVLTLGLERMDRLCLRERYADHSTRIHHLRQDWLRYAIGKGHEEALRSGLASLEREIIVAHLEATKEKRQMVSARARLMVFSYAKSVRLHTNYPLNSTQRFLLSCLFIECVQRYAGLLLEQGDYAEAREWVRDLIGYVFVKLPFGGGELREFDATWEGVPSVRDQSLGPVHSISS